MITPEMVDKEERTKGRGGREEQDDARMHQAFGMNRTSVRHKGPEVCP